jgi:hypothetical protein
VKYEHRVHIAAIVAVLIFFLAITYGSFTAVMGDQQIKSERIAACTQIEDPTAKTLCLEAS